MNGRIVERIFSVAYAKESCALLIGRRAQTGNLEQLCTRCESTVLTTIVNDILGQCGAKSAYVHQQVLRGGVEIYAN